MIPSDQFVTGDIQITKMYMLCFRINDMLYFYSILKAEKGVLILENVMQKN